MALPGSNDQRWCRMSQPGEGCGEWKTKADQAQPEYEHRSISEWHGTSNGAWVRRKHPWTCRPRRAGEGGEGEQDGDRWREPDSQGVQKCTAKEGQKDKERGSEGENTSQQNYMK